MNQPFDVIIGLEVHVQLATLTKIFCSCSTAFNPDQPNVQTCPVCLGLPGALPVLNRRAFELAIKTALGLQCQIAPFTKWDRKQYYYPDLPKGYQISQYDLPFSHSGAVDVAIPPATEGAASPGQRHVRILRAHLEEDAGKNLHDESGRGRDSQVDLNRAGTPLVEIVTEPDLRSAAEARQFLEELRLLLTYLEVSDCNMQEGSLRCDANVNLHVHQPDGSRLATPIVEIKNLNSFRFTEQAIEYEIVQQWEQFHRTGKTIGTAPKATHGFNAATGKTYVLREKEEAADYRYFPDPDLVPVTVTAEQQAAIAATMCELPAARRERFVAEFQLSPYDAAVIIDQGRAVADYFETVAKASGDPKQAANWVTQDVLRELNKRNCALADFPITAEVLSSLLERVHRKQITLKSARFLFEDLLAAADERGEPIALAEIDAMIAAKGLAVVEDTAAIDAVITKVLERSAKAIADYRAGKQAAVGALIGQVMKECKGADPNTVRARIVSKIEGG